MSSPPIVIDGSVNDVCADAWFAEPAGFNAIPVDAILPEPGSPAADALRAATAPFLDSAPNELVRQQFIAHIGSGQALLGALREIGTVHCSLGLHRDDCAGSAGRPPRPLMSLLTFSWRASAVASRAAMAARAVTGTAGHTRVEYAELPCGPATFSESVRTPAGGTHLPPLPVLQIYAHLPHPDCKRLATLAISTMAIQRREEYRTILRWVAETVRFENPMKCTNQDSAGLGDSSWVGTPP